MPDFSRFSAFARKVGVALPECNTCNTEIKTEVLQDFRHDFIAVTRVTPVTPEEHSCAQGNPFRELAEDVLRDYYSLDDPMNPDAWR